MFAIIHLPMYIFYKVFSYLILITMLGVFNPILQMSNRGLF